MTRAEHYKRAEALLMPVDHRESQGNGLGPMGPDLIALAQVHATLSTADAVVAGEEYPERWVLAKEPAVDQADGLRERLARLAADLEDAGPSHVAARIREELAK